MTSRVSLSLLAALFVGCAPAAAQGRVGLPSIPLPEEMRSLQSVGVPAEPGPIEQAPAIEEEELQEKIPALDLPSRPSGAKTGTQFLDSLEGLGRGAIDKRVLEEVLSGNVPAYQRTLTPITLAGESGAVATLHVMTDYLAIGSDENFIRMPMTSAAAQTICDELDMSLPTKKVVDEIYLQSKAKLPPSYIDGGPTEDELADFLFHHETLETRRKKAGFELGELLAGHKKDIVLSTRLRERHDRVAIYGWHKKDGTVIQPLSCKHSCRYADYSHGVRLVAQAMTIDDAPRRFSEVIGDLDEADIVSDEGPLTVREYPRTLP